MDIIYCNHYQIKIILISITNMSSSTSSARPPRVYRTSPFSRERNRMHARKTRQRKKEHMQKLQTRADELKLEQIRLKQAINEKNTANILVGLFQNNDGTENADNIDPKVEVLLKRSIDDIPDAQKIPELPALILPGQHNGKRKSTGSVESDGDKEVPEELQEDGIDYKLLGKDRSSCTPAELDQIRRERNRMHAKRTRDRKRIFMELMEVMIKELEDENALLLAHANKLNVYVPPPTEDDNNDDDMMFPAQPITPPLAPMSSPANPLLSSTQTSETQTTKGDFQNQIESLLAAGSAFRKREMCEINAISCAESDVTASTNHSDQHNSFGEEEECYPNKRQCMSSDFPTSVPKSITTTNYSL